MRFILLSLLILIPLNQLIAQSPDLEKLAVIAQSKVNPQINGVIEPQEWGEATLIDDLYQVRPNEYAEPSEKTELFVKYDTDYLYVAAKLYEQDPNQITANISRQGANNDSDDAIRIFIDPYNSKRAGYLFALNLNEVRTDGIFLNITNFSEDWQGIWEGKAQRTDYGWSAEIAIPFKTLTFEASNDTWGFNVYRYIARNDEMSGWISKNRSDNASISGDLKGLVGINQGMGLDIVPSVSLSNRRIYNPQNDQFDFEPSVDLFYKITPSLNGAITINTDFSATEVDDRQVDLSQFNLFFPEKRDFFLREFDIFDFGGIGGNTENTIFPGPEAQNARPFFSRNIGLSATGAPVDIIGGAKISGKIGNYDVGALVVEQDEFQSIDASTLFVGRFAADILDESSIGAIVTHGDPKSNADNSLVGIDFRYRNSRLGAGKRIDANLWYQKSKTEGINNRDAAWSAMFSMPNSTAWRGLAQYQRVEENFNPTLGFVSRTGVDLRRGMLGYTFRYNHHPWLRSIFTKVEARRWDFLDDGRLQSSQYSFQPAKLTSNAGDSLAISVHRFGEGVYANSRQPLVRAGITLPYKEYYWDRVGMILQTSKSRVFDAKFLYFDGQFYTGSRISSQIDLGWRLTPKFSLSAGYTYWDARLPEGDFKLRQVDAKTEWALSSTLSWVNVIQYDNISANLGINSRLHWTPTAGQNIYFVINHNFNELAEDNFVSSANEITLKASYTFRF